MKTLWVLFVSFTLGSTAYGQMIMPDVLGSAGDYFVNTSGNAALSFTVGEMTMVETFSAQGHFLTQGFQQPEFIILAVEEDSPMEELSIFPNPASDWFQVRFRLKYPGDLQLSLVDLRGVTVWEKEEWVYSGVQSLLEVPASQLSQGMYFLRLRFLAPQQNIENISHHKIEIVR